MLRFVFFGRARDLWPGNNFSQRPKNELASGSRRKKESSACPPTGIKKMKKRQNRRRLKKPAGPKRKDHPARHIGGRLETQGLRSSSLMGEFPSVGFSRGVVASVCPSPGRGARSIHRAIWEGVLTRFGPWAIKEIDFWAFTINLLRPGEPPYKLDALGPGVSH